MLDEFSHAPAWGAAGGRRGQRSEGWHNGRREDSGREELADNRVRLQVEVPCRSREARRGARLLRPRGQHEDPRLPEGQRSRRRCSEARIGRDRIFTEAVVRSHINALVLNAADDASVRPVTQPELNYDLPSSEDEPFNFTAEFAVQAPPEVAEWAGLEVPAPEPTSPTSWSSASSMVLRASVAELCPGRVTARRRTATS